MSKGITPVIAIVLLLMITIALIGFAYVWFQHTATGLTSNIGRQVNRTTTQMGESITITSCDVSNKIVYVKNIGSSSIILSNTDLYVEGKLIPDSCGDGVAAPGKTFSCDLPDDIESGDSVKIVTGGGSVDEISCP
ncbi:MAG: hypothetical protein B6U68_01840 [Candidatus Aenigmarchaeota archaeon ex4484_14]|nr:MAG: hypothetical protein B6U68_01840 [Candidatus Aenigmarchaeota archaeon ex4484_14]